MSRLMKGIIKNGAHAKYFGFVKNAWDDGIEFPSFDNFYEVYPEGLVVETFQESSQYPNYTTINGVSVVTHVAINYWYVFFFKERG